MSDDAATPPDLGLARVLGPHGPLEHEVHGLLAAGSVDAATAALLRALGGELLGFLRALTSNPTDADDAFSVLAIGIWRGLPGFAWRSSLRTWSYVLARRSLGRLRRGQLREELLSRPSAIDRVVADSHVHSLSHLDPVRDGFADLRGQLDPDDQILLVLRVDRQMPWREAAEVLAEDGEDVERLTANLRKRFERIKARIRTLARAAGLQ